VLQCIAVLLLFYCLYLALQLSSNQVARCLQHFNTLQRTATHCNTLQHTINQEARCLQHCNTLQHTAPHCNKLKLNLDESGGTVSVHGEPKGVYKSEMKEMKAYANVHGYLQERRCALRASGVLQCVAVSCSELQCAAVCGSV